MTIHLGNVDASSTLYIPFATYAGSTGASATLTGLAVTDIEIYKNGSVTQRASDAGYALLDTDGIDFDGITGIHGFSVDLSDNTDAGFYSAGAFYWVVVSAVTVDSQTVNFIAATFRIGPAAANVTQWLGTAASTPTVAGVPNVNVKTWNDLTTVALPLVPTTAGRTLDVSAGGEAGIDWANVGSPTTVVGLSGTTVKTATDVETDTADIQTRIPAALVSGRMDSSVGAMAANVMTAAAAAADLTTELQAGLATDALLTTVAGYLDTEIADIRNRLPAALVGGRMDSNLSAIGNDTTALTGFKRAVLGNVIGTCDAGSTTTSIVTSALTPAGAAADQLKGRIVVFDKDTTTAALRGQATDITASTNAATPTLTVTALTTAPASGDTFVIV